jgi:hypothetical protein
MRRGNQEAHSTLAWSNAALAAARCDSNAAHRLSSAPSRAAMRYPQMRRAACVQTSAANQRVELRQRTRSAGNNNSHSHMFAASARSNDVRAAETVMEQTHREAMRTLDMRLSGGMCFAAKQVPSTLLGTSDSSEQGSAEAMSVVAVQRVISPALSTSSKLRLILIS